MGLQTTATARSLVIEALLGREVSGVARDGRGQRPSVKEIALERRRSAMAADWIIQTCAPAWLRLAGLEAQADVVATLPGIEDLAASETARAPGRGQA